MSNENFEQKLVRIEELLGKMEQGSLNLTEQIAAFKEGITLIKSCEEQIDKAEGVVKKLISSKTLSNSASSVEESFQDFETHN
ncbi:MAG: exodeoxyribonuclease VII small subunit [Succinivibrionaceae bacterium]